MKKQIAIIILSVFLFSCSKTKQLSTATQNSRTKLLDKLAVSTTRDNKELAGQIITGILTKDIDKIKLLFSKQSLLEISDLDNQIKDLIDLVNETDIKEYEIENGFEGMSREMGVTEKLSRSCFIWFPNYEESQYRIIIEYYKINLETPELEGVVSISLYKQIKYESPETIIKIGDRKI